ncbi:MAG: hypothetical protein ABJN04_15630 [Hyphomicrobiales bacterium]
MDYILSEERSVYIKRTINIDRKACSEDKLLDDTKVIVVLAEPGAGKTELLRALADRLGVKRYRASIFKNQTQFEQTDTLIIDSLDELAKIDQLAIDAIIVKSAELKAKKIIFASRSAQWETARSRTIKEVFEVEPVVARLEPFSEDEQRELFQAYKPDQNFDLFFESLKKIDLHGLLGNPQLLKIFADAYLESEGLFTSKKQVFHDAITQLASEKNLDQPQFGRPATKDIIERSDEVFCKILLSGCAGVSTIESAADRDFPYVRGLTASRHELSAAAIETSLFRPSDASDQHEPVHRIIAEYSAARYLVSCIQDTSDLLSLKRALALIAPNNTPRDELRGLLAWMASEGDQDVESAVINIDPYSIFSNGDPSQLTAQSKSLLLTRIAQVADQNPYFRGGDVWRKFSVSGFFSSDIAEATRMIIRDTNTASQLRHLVLELLQGTPAAIALNDELEGLVLNAQFDEVSRILALRNLHPITKSDAVVIFKSLLQERSFQSIPLAAEILEYNGIGALGVESALNLFKTIDEKYFVKNSDATEQHLDGSFSRYFITNLINSISSEHTVWLLDELNCDLECDCERDKAYDCFCRHGRSYLIGKLLDRLFELNEVKPKAEQIWKWTKGLRYKHSVGRGDSAAVTALSDNDALRRSVHRIAFVDLTDEDDIFKRKVDLFLLHGHSGIAFRKDDFQVLSDFAFETDNVFLWACFFPYHSVYEKDKRENPYRTHMRQQAREKPEFGKIWARYERARKKQDREQASYSFRRATWLRRDRRRKREVQAKNQEYFDANLSLIESGKHWGFLRLFAEGYLRQDQKNFPEMEDASLPINALLNCFDFLRPSIPDLKEISISTGTFYSVMIANAACLAHFRKYKNLNDVPCQILSAVMTEANVSYSNGNDEDKNEYQAEIEHQLFQSLEQVEAFLRQLIEPQIADSTRQHTNVDWLSYRKIFEPLKLSLSIDWLERFPDMHLYPTRLLFDMAAQVEDLSRLLKVITKQIKSLDKAPQDEEALKAYNEKRDFWHLRKFILFDQCEAGTIAWLGEKKERLLEIANITDSSFRGNSKNWSELSAEKIRIILEAFIDKWPKVHLPNSHGTSSPTEEKGYRFLTEIKWKIGNDAPERAIPILDRLINDSRFVDFLGSLKTQKAEVLKKLALRDFSAPSPEDLVEMLDNHQIATMEDLRAVALEMLEETQAWISGGETDPVEQFYNPTKDGAPKRVDENTATKRTVERLQLQCKALGLAVSIEHHLHDGKRSDITLRRNVSGVERLLVIEAKGQWHKDLYTAAMEQLEARYSIHPSAAGQGIYLVYWFGEDYKVADKQNHDIRSSEELKERIIEGMPVELRSRVDVFVLDVSI